MAKKRLSPVEAEIARHTRAIKSLKDEKSRIERDVANQIQKLHARIQNRNAIIAALSKQFAPSARSSDGT